MPSSPSPALELYGEGLSRALVHPVDQPFSREDGDWLCWLWKGEAQIVIALASALQWEGSMTTDISNGERLWRAMTRLRDVGFQFAAIEITEAGDLFPTRAKAVEPENLNWVLLFAQCLSKIPRARAMTLEWASYEKAAQFAAKAARGIPLLAQYEPLLHDFNEKVQKDMRELRKVEPPPEARRRVQEALKDAALN